MSDLRDEVARYRWAHTIDLGEGQSTPGLWSRADQAHIYDALDRVDFRGKTVLDIGCWDGLWSFESEWRGAAEVWATDDVRQRPWSDQPTFNLARRILGSHAHYIPDLPVYEINRREQAFDIVLFLGVYYHLRHPLLALSRIRQVLRPDGLLLIEGEVSAGPECSAAFYYDRPHKEPSNWWIPTVSCLEQWVRASCFDVVGPIVCTGDGPFARATLLARAVCRPEPEQRGIDDDLKAYHVLPAT